MSKYNIRLYTILLILFHAFTTNGQSLNLYQALDSATTNYPGIKASQNEMLTSQRNLKEARTEYIPELVFGHQYTYSTNNNVTGTSWPNQGTALSPSGGSRPENIYDAVYGSHTSFLIDWNLISFGKISSNIQVTKAEYELSKLEYENEIFKHKIKVIDAYLLFIGSSELLEAAKHNYKRAEAFKNASEAKGATGLVSQVEVSIADAELAKARMAVLQNEASYNAYMLSLIELLGLSADSLQVDTMNFFNKIPQLSNDINDGSSSPILQIANKQIEISQARAISTKRSYYPSLSLAAAGWARGSGISNLDGSYRTDFESGTDYQVYNYLLGVALRWNITSYFSIRQRYKADVFQTRKNEMLYDAKKLEVSRQIKEANLQLSNFIEQSKLAPVQLKAANMAYNQAKARYDNGLLDLPTFMQTIVTLNRAEADAYLTYTNTWRSLLLRAALAGNIDLFLTSIQK